MDLKHDQAFLNILSQEKNITSFLDRLFGFLYRCTDFYIESGTEERLGFPKGVAEELVFYTFRKWKNVKSHNERSTQVDGGMQCNMTDSLAQLDNLQASRSSEDSTSSVKSCATNTPTLQPDELKSLSESMKNNIATPESYNGGSFENYKWSQSISDLDVVVNLPSSISNSKQLRVFLNADMLEVAVIQTSAHNRKLNEWRCIVKGELTHKIKISESFWCLEACKHVTLHLQKADERWWEALLDKEPRIQLSKIDCSKSFEDMGEREQMKVQELIYQQQNKLQIQKTPTTPKPRSLSKSPSRFLNSQRSLSPSSKVVLHNKQQRS